MTNPSQQPERLRVAHLNPRAPTDFALHPDADARSRIAEELNLDGLPRLAFEGRVRPEGGDAWTLEGRLTARVVQPCVVTLKPVRSDISDDVRIRFTPHMPDVEAEEVEMLDETLEPLGNFIDLTAIMVEAISLALPEYPRAEGARLDEVAPDVAAEPTPDTRRPFAGLDQLLKKDGGES